MPDPPDDSFEATLKRLQDELDAKESTQRPSRVTPSDSFELTKRRLEIELAAEEIRTRERQRLPKREGGRFRFQETLRDTARLIQENPFGFLAATTPVSGILPVKGILKGSELLEEHVQKPGAGFIASQIREESPLGRVLNISEFERNLEAQQAAGAGPLQARTQAFQQTEFPWGVHTGLLALADPLNLVGLAAVRAPATALPKVAASLKAADAAKRAAAATTIERTRAQLPSAVRAPTVRAAGLTPEEVTELGRLKGRLALDEELLADPRPYSATIQQLGAPLRPGIEGYRPPLARTAAGRAEAIVDAKDVVKAAKEEVADAQRGIKDGLLEPDDLTEAKSTLTDARADLRQANKPTGYTAEDKAYIAAADKLDVEYPKRLRASIQRAQKDIAALEARQVVREVPTAAPTVRTTVDRISGAIPLPPVRYPSLSPQVYNQATVKVGAVLRSGAAQRTRIEASRSEALKSRIPASARAAQEADPLLAGQAAKSRLAGPLTEPATIQAAQLTTDEVRALFSRIWHEIPDLRHFDKLDTDTALHKVLSAQVPTRSELVHLRRVFGSSFANNARRLISGPERLRRDTLNVLNAPRAIVASYDYSAPFRQGILLAAGHPVAFSRNFTSQMRALVSEDYARAVESSIRDDPLFGILAQKTGARKHALDITEFGPDRALVAGEEPFMSTLFSRFPGIRGSERGYATFLNKLRWDISKDTYSQWVQSGVKFTDADVDNLVQWMNIATGRGNIPLLSPSGLEAMNAVFFSPRLLASRFQAPFKIVSFNALESPATVARIYGNVGIRKMVAKDLAAFVGTGIGVMSLLNRLPGVEVTANPFSSDFGKIRVGKTSIEFWGGYQQLARYGAQILFQKAERPTRGGEVRGVPWALLGGRFLRSKLAPGPSLLTDVWLRKDFLGRPIDVRTPTGLGGQAFARLTPFFVRDLIEAYNEQGLVSGALALTGGIGASVGTFETVNEVSLDILNMKYKDIGSGRSKRSADFLRRRVRDELDRRRANPTGRIPGGSAVQRIINIPSEVAEGQR
jgi:hypothetical protein